MINFFLFGVGLLSFCAPFIVYAIEATKGDEDQDIEIWLSKKSLNQINLMNGMMLAGMLLMNAGPLLPN